jgi:hypothetical protein
MAWDSMLWAWSGVHMVLHSPLRPKQQLGGTVPARPNLHQHRPTIAMQAAIAHTLLQQRAGTPLPDKSNVYIVHGDY